MNIHGTQYGYCRISTKKQNIERQIRNIKAEYAKKQDLFGPAIYA